MKPLDLLVLLLLFKNQQRRKVVESLIKNKIRAGIFTEDLVISTFQKHMAPLKQHTVPVLGLAESLLECSVDIVACIASRRWLGTWSWRRGRYYEGCYRCS